MVNLDKWEKVESFSDIQKGDLIRTVRSLKDDSHADVRGIVYELKTINYREAWYTKGGWRIADEIQFRNKTDETAIVYRRLPEPFDFPKGVGAVVEAKYNEGFSTTKFIFDGLMWVRANGGTSNSENHVRNNYKNFKTLSEGISK